MKKLVGIVVAVCLLWGMMAVAQDDVKGTIGFTFHSSRVTFQKILLDEFMKEADKYPGITVNIIDPEVDIERQLNAIETFIAQEVDVIVSSPLDFQGSIPGVEAANAAGIPYIAMNCTVGGGDHVYAGSSNLEAGQLQGEYLREKLPEGAKILYLRGQEGMQHTMERREGIQLELLDKRPDVELLAEQTANYHRTEGMRVMEDWIQAFPEVDAVVAANDEMALGAIEALKGANRLEGVMVLGIDATPDAIASVRAGEMTMTVLQDAPGQAKKAFEVAIMALKGEKLEKEYLIPFYPVTLENVDEFFPEQ
jgi:inositol transport system substrate-binding protein